jgi:hypothetical protein
MNDFPIIKGDGVPEGADPGGTGELDSDLDPVEDAMLVDEQQSRSKNKVER